MLSVLIQDYVNMLLDQLCNPCFNLDETLCHAVHDSVVACFTGAFGAASGFMGPFQSFIESGVGNFLIGLGEWIGGTAWNAKCRK